MKAWHRPAAWLLLITFSMQAFLPTTAHAKHFFGRLGRLAKEHHYHGTPPVVCEDSHIDILAENIDWVEHHLDRYGSIVAKQPDIWGEARLTKHRDEYERMMHRELNQFQFKLNAAISQTDSSYLAQTLALTNVATDGNASIPKITRSSANTAIAFNNSTDTTFDKNTATTGEPFGRVYAIDKGDKLDIEPTIHLDQMSRYLQHLHELRRINEGDDTSDSPGYALNLVRIPVSMLPGKLTRIGFGAEITVTATPVLSDDLLPTTFRNLVINDLVDQLGLPLVRTVEDEKGLKAREEWRIARKHIDNFGKFFTTWNYLNSAQDRQEAMALIGPALDNPKVRQVLLATIDNLWDTEEIPGIKAISDAITDKDLDQRIEKHATQIFPDPNFTADQLAYFTKKLTRHSILKDPTDLDKAKKAFLSAVLSMGERDVLDDSGWNNLLNTISGRSNQPSYRSTKKQIEIAMTELSTHFIETIEKQVRKEITSAMSELTFPQGVTSSGRQRRAHHPLPPSQAYDVYGLKMFLTMAEFFCPRYSGRHVRWNGAPRCSCDENSGEPRVSLLDAQKWLRAEIAAAYDLFNQPHHMQLLYQLANPESGLAKAIRGSRLYGEPIVNSNLLPMAYQSPLPAPGERIYPEAEVYPEEEVYLEEVEQYQEYPVSKPALVEVGEMTANWSVERYRKYFFRMLHANLFSPEKDENERRRGNEVLEQLAWAIVVESALLNERLNEDVRKTFKAKHCYCGEAPLEDLSYFLPEFAARPDSGVTEQFMAATKTFQDYVKCRWPIHVFAVDPREQDQNVADVSRRKREMQFALAVGFVSGQIGANSLTEYSRTLDTQIETIALNRTVVGFSHGNDTFGWRFHPRVQGLHVPGTLGTIKQSICGVSRDDDLKHRQLEPGMRECVAIVLMPSFVPYADFDVRTNWFRLTNPKNAAFTMKDTMRFSKAITAMRHSKAQCAKCEHCYRPGEINRLMRRVHQLDRELPLQTMRAQVPYENTLGGFEMFNTGVTDLSPELIGWYGAPGVVVSADDTNQYGCGCSNEANCQTTSDAEQSALATHVSELHAGGTEIGKQPPLLECPGKGTTLFLVGDNFSVHDTKLIAGGVCIPHVRLISREIMRVTIPSCVNTVCIDGKEYVAIYAATPYGITNHLHVPVYCRSKNKPCEHCKALTNTPCKSEDANGSGESSVLIPEPVDDPTVMHLIPLPAVTETETQHATYMQDNTEETSEANPLQEAVETIQQEVSTINQKVITINQGLTELNEGVTEALATPKLTTKPEVIVNVQTVDAITQELKKRKKKECGPVATQMKTKMRECWRNLRDKLPCN